MSTSGVYGFYKDGITKVAYSFQDSYISELGYKILNFIKNTNVDKLNEMFGNIQMVDFESKPTNKQIEECLKWYDDSIDNDNTKGWYYLLRKAQGRLESYNDGLKYMIDAKDFLKDSLYCEYGYIINLDNNKLEVYVGFQKEPQENRYYTDTSLYGERYEYYNCKLIKEFDLEKVEKYDLDLIEEEVTRGKQAI